MDRARIQLLQQMPIFGGIDDEALQFLLDPVPSVSVSKGAFFFREREPTDGMFVLESGHVSVLKEWAGRELQLHRLDAGRFGDCLECGDPISLARLRVQPAAARCARCQAASERAQPSA